MAVDIAISARGGLACYPSVLEGAQVTWELSGVAGKLTFSCVEDDLLIVDEGAAVHMQVDGKDFFSGYVVTMERGKQDILKITAVDQLFYLIKNKDTYNYQGKTAGQLLRMIAADYQLAVGMVDDGGYVIQSRCEQDETLLDILLNALDEAALNANQLYVLYDDCGFLTLKNLESMYLDLLIDEEGAEDYRYSSSIENGVYNKIRIVHEDTEAGVRGRYEASDTANIARWGVLQLTEKVETAVTAKQKAETMLNLYNRPRRTFSIQNALGDARVRGGSLIGVKIRAGKQDIMQFFIVNAVTHTFNEGQHLMNLTLTGGLFSA